MPSEAPATPAMDVRPLLDRLREAHPDAACALAHGNPFQLLIATILSAQCTDARVNMVTPGLFARYPDPAAMSAVSQEELESIIRSTGFYRNKSKAIRGASQRLTEAFGGQVPRTMDELLSLPGVARKTANVVLGVGYGIADGVVVDTHVFRLARRLGLSRAKNTEDVERDLMRIVPREDWIHLSHLLIFHGRRVCIARKPMCGVCPVASLCPSASYFLAGRTPPWERARVGDGAGAATKRPTAKKRAAPKKRAPAKRRPATKKRVAAKKRAPARRKAK